MSFIDVIKQRRSQRTVTERQNGLVEVISIIRTKPFHWIAVAEFAYQGAHWVESITFHVTLDHGTAPATRVIRVSDTDFDEDRDMTMYLGLGDARSMPQIILDFIVQGRW